jgi:hypothetical protein
MATPPTTTRLGSPPAPVPNGTNTHLAAPPPPPSPPPPPGGPLIGSKFNVLNRFISRLDAAPLDDAQSGVGGAFGFQVLRNANHEVPLEPWFDFIIGINGRTIVSLSFCGVTFFYIFFWREARGEGKENEADKS